MPPNKIFLSGSQRWIHLVWIIDACNSNKDVVYVHVICKDSVSIKPKFVFQWIKMNAFATILRPFVNIALNLKYFNTVVGQVGCFHSYRSRYSILVFCSIYIPTYTHRQIGNIHRLGDHVYMGYYSRYNFRRNYYDKYVPCCVVTISLKICQCIHVHMMQNFYFHYC